MTTVATILNEARKYLGVAQYSAQHKAIIDTYNATKPLPVGYAVKYSDDWCDAFISFLAIKTKSTDIIGRECGVQRHIDIFKKLGIWNENGQGRPKPGDIITFNWDFFGQNNDGWADHIGIVESVSDTQITTIEGNTDRAVRRRTYQIGNGWIRGFARPKYQSATVNPPKTDVKDTVKKSNSTLAEEVKAGKWGNDPQRSQQLKAAGYDPVAIQKLVDAAVNPSRKSNETIAKEVLAGTWGNDPQRSRDLKAAGYDTKAIQALVNKGFPSSTPTPAPRPILKGENLPNKGTFKFGVNTNIRTGPGLSYPIRKQNGKNVFYNAGQSVNYTKKVIADGYVWLYYKSYSGQDSWVAVV